MRAVVAVVVLDLERSVTPISVASIEYHGYLSFRSFSGYVNYGLLEREQCTPPRGGIIF